MSQPQEQQNSQGKSTPSFWDRLLNGDENNPPWAEHPAVVILTLIFLFPVGLYLLWRYTKWDYRLKWGLTGGALLIIVAANLIAPSGSTATKSASDPTSIQGEWWGFINEKRGQILVVDDSKMRIITTDGDLNPIEGVPETVYEYQIIPNTSPVQINRRRISPPLAPLEKDVTLHGIFQIENDVLLICEELDGKESQRPTEFRETRDGRGIIFTSLTSWHRGPRK